MIFNREITRDGFSMLPYDASAQASSTWVGSLSKDVMLFIFGLLKGRETAKCGEVCKHWKQLTQEDSLWKSLLQRDFPNARTQAPKLTYQKHHLINSNLASGKYTSSEIHTDEAIYTLIYTGHDQLITGSSEGEIKVWDLKINQCVKKMKEISNKILSFAFTENGELIAGLDGGMIKIWDLMTGACIKTFQEENTGAWITSLVLTKKRRLISGSTDGAIRIWNLNTMTCENTLQEHQSWVTSFVLTKDEQYLISGSYDGNIKTWDLKTGTCVSILTKSRGEILALILTEQQQLIASYRDGPIGIWDLKTGVCEKSIQKNESGILSLNLTEKNHLISGAMDGKIRIWGLDYKSYIEIEGRANWHSYLILAQEKLISCADNMLKIWDFASSNKTIFQELAQRFEQGDSHEYEIAMQRFSRMPEKEKKKIYTELCAILEYDPMLDEEDHLTDLWQNSTSGQKAQAIRNYILRSV